MSLTIRQGDFIADELRLSQGDKVVPIWMPTTLNRQMVKSFPAEVFPNGRLCRISEVSNGSYEFLNEREAFQAGKERVTINDGKQFTLTLTLEGNALEAQAAILGQDLHEYAGIRQGQTISNVGHLALIKAGTDNKVLSSYLIPNIEAKLTDITGVTDGTSTYSMELTTRSEVYWVGGQAIPVQEVWFAGTSPKDGSTTIVNAAAPDGVLTEFPLGTGNGAGVAASPLAVPFNRDAGGGVDSYLVEVRENGTTISGHSYNPATGVKTLASAPAAGTHLSTVYFVRTGARAWSNDVEYGIGEIVQYDGAYFISDDISTGTTPNKTTPVSPWLAYTGFGWDGSAGVGTPVTPYVSNGRTSMFASLNARQVI